MASSFETLAEFIIGPRFARTRWQAPQDEDKAACDAARLIHPACRGLDPLQCRHDLPSHQRYLDQNGDATYPLDDLGLPHSFR